MLLASLFAVLRAPAAEEPRRNWFDDPFATATQGLPGCPVPLGPMLTEAEMRREGHARVERGASCWLAGRCESPNAYRDDHAINAEAAAALAREPRLARSALWLTTQRRFVFVQGCVPDRATAARVVAVLRQVPRIEYVGDELMVGTRGKPPYSTAPGR